MLEALVSSPRVTVRRHGLPDPDGACVVYWMQRAQRAWDNPALDVAIAAGDSIGKPVVVFFGLHPYVARGNHRHYHFLAEGLPDIADGLRRRRVGFVLRRYPDHSLLRFVEEARAALVVGDENPLRQLEGWRRTVAETLRLPFWTVDADVVVPVKLLKREQYAARTIRPRIMARLDEFLEPEREPKARVAPDVLDHLPTLRPSPAVLDGVPLDRSAGPVAGLRGGTAEARKRLRAFIRSRLAHYDERRNHPEDDGTSQLSPYLHFGHLGPREVARAARASGLPHEAVAPFVEQLVVRRELAINFVTFNPDYDSLDGCEEWARRTLAKHRRDPRPHLYTAEQFEAADTCDPLWNAAQVQLVTTGWMHGYVRMYWAKKILEWTRTPAEALAIAIALNDRYELDGRDPNGYANIAWAIGGKHDRPWPERPVFGTVRSMSFASTSTKFDAAAYIDRYRSL